MVKHLEIYRGENEPEDRNSFLWLHTNPEGKRVLEEYNGVSWQPVSAAEGGPSGSDMLSITYEELKALRNEGKLVAGQQYRITDYHCTTMQENTQSADHQFDIIVTADDEKTLNENARAIVHIPDGKALYINQPDGKYILVRKPEKDRDGFYCFYYNDGYDEHVYSPSLTPVEGAVVYWEAEGDITEASSDYTFHYEAAMDYFSQAGANLAAWELKYCLDNDTERFAWAQKQNMIITNDAVYYERDESKDIIGAQYPYAFTETDESEPETIYVASPTPKVGDITYHPGWEPDPNPYGQVASIVQEGFEGTGVIYYMKDEWNNECPYDFKNIQFQRKLTDGAYDPDNGDDTWVYTFNAYNIDEDTHLDATLLNHTPIGDGGCMCKGNVIKEFNMQYAVGSKYSLIRLNYNVFLNTYSISDESYFECHSNTFGNNCDSNTFGDVCSSNTFGNWCYSNTFGDGCSSNTFGNDCYSNTFGDGCSSNTFGNDCYSNTFGDGCSSNTFVHDCYSNTFGDGCSSNTFVHDCYSNTFGNNCNSNTFGDVCYSNTFGDGCYSNTFGNWCDSNNFGNGCYFNTFGNGCHSNTFGDGCSSNTFVHDCYSNTFGNRCRRKHFEYTSDMLEVSGQTPGFWFNGEKKW